MTTSNDPPAAGHPRDKDHPKHEQWAQRIREGMLKRWKKAPAKERAALAKRTGQASRARWQKPKWRSKKARSEFAAYVSSHIKERTAGGRPRSEDRCPCGRYTRAYAKGRNHRCEETNGGPATI